jgi:hypothetical protein
MSDLVDVTTVTDTSAALHVDGDAYYFEGLTPDAAHSKWARCAAASER